MISKLALTRIGTTTPQLAAKQQATSRYSSILQLRSLSSLDKLKTVLEEYRVRNYGQCIPSRFKKEIISAASTKDYKQQDVVTVDSLFAVMINIGASQQVSRRDMETIFSQIDDDGKQHRPGTISKDRMLKLFQNK